MTNIGPAVIATSTALTSVLAQINSLTTVSLGQATTVYVFSATLAIWITRKLQKIEDEQLAIRKDIERLPCTSCPPKKDCPS
jgi:hypothetical protein